MDQLIRNVVQITKLSNQLQTTAQDSQQDRELRLKLCQGVFQSIIDSQKYINPQNSKTIDFLVQDNFKQNSIQKIDFLEGQNLDSVDIDIQGLHSKYQKKQILKKEQQLNQMYGNFLETVTDDLLEMTDRQIDQFKKNKKESSDLTGFKITQENQKRQKMDLSMRKPQQQWWSSIDNSYGPFVPMLSNKPHHIEPLSQQLLEAQQIVQTPESIKKFVFGDHRIQSNQSTFQNPYKTEIENFDQNFSEIYNLFSSDPYKVEIEQIKSLESVQFDYVETEESLRELTDHLNQDNVKEIAIDLEAHQQRSYQGFTCLMQITTRFRDFVIDVIKMRNLIGDYLRPIFDDPSKVKVLHGADMDIQWLQRDFGLYVVNMFDTGQAARLLQLKSFGLAHLLQRYCQIIANKEYQLADWRQRPLSDEMLKYSREDTHYLLHIYDNIRNDLVQKGIQLNSQNPNALLLQALHKSQALCLRVYEKPQVKDYNYHAIIQRNQLHNTLVQTSILKALLKFRDFIARQEDESPNYMIANHVIFQLASSMPTSKNEYRDCCRQNYTNFLMKYQEKIIQIIQDKIEKSKIKKENPNRSYTKQHVLYENVEPAVNPESLLHQKKQQEEQNMISNNENLILVNQKLPEFKVNMSQQKFVKNNQEKSKDNKKILLLEQFELIRINTILPSKIKSVLNHLQQIQESEQNIYKIFSLKQQNDQFKKTIIGKKRSQAEQFKQNDKEITTELNQDEIKFEEDKNEIIRLRDIKQEQNNTQSLRQRFSKKQKQIDNSNQEYEQQNNQFNEKNKNIQKRQNDTDSDQDSSQEDEIIKPAQQSKWQQLYSQAAPQISNIFQKQIDSEISNQANNKKSNKKERGKNSNRKHGEEKKKKYSIGNMREDIISGNAGGGASRQQRN